MCKQCQNNFLLKIVETNSTEEALTIFKHEYNDYHLPNVSEVIEEGESIGFKSYSQHIEGIRSRLYYELSHKERELNKIYVYKSELLKRHDLLVVICVANRKGYACTSFNYIPGRRF